MQKSATIIVIDDDMDDQEVIKLTLDSFNLGIPSLFFENAENAY